jgi:hypothetical protein
MGLGYSKSRLTEPEGHIIANPGPFQGWGNRSDCFTDYVKPAAVRNDELISIIAPLRIALSPTTICYLPNQGWMV